MTEITLYQVDAFTDEPFKGNPCAVVFDAEPLDTVTMQAIAREMNLSETVFVPVPPRPVAPQAGETTNHRFGDPAG